MVTHHYVYFAHSDYDAIPQRNWKELVWGAHFDVQSAVILIKIIKSWSRVLHFDVWSPVIPVKDWKELVRGNVLMCS